MTADDAMTADDRFFRILSYPPYMLKNPQNLSLAVILSFPVIASKKSWENQP
jgi:hypothetical protein